MLRDINMKTSPAMSALPPKADMCSATRYVRFGPIADIAMQRSAKSRQSL